MKLASFDWPKSLEAIGNDAFSECSSLASVEFHKGLQDVGQQAFAGCRSLREVVIPEGVENLGFYAFSGCTGLVSLVIKDGVNFIDSGTFYGCRALTTIKLAQSVTRIEASAFNDCSGIREVEAPTWFKFHLVFPDAFSSIQKVTIRQGATNISENAYFNLSSLTNISIPATVSEIGNYAFSGTGLKELSIPDGVQIVRSGLCAGCGDLQELHIPYSVGIIEQSAFAGCHNLESIAIPSSATNIAGNAFSSCDQIRNVMVPGHCLLQGVFPDTYEQITNVVINADSRVVGSVCNYCRGLVSVSIPDGVEEIGSAAFLGCESLQSITLPKSVREIGSYAFSGCTQLKDVELPLGARNVSDGLFMNCTSLTRIEIPEGVTNLGYCAFHNCSSLTYVSIPATVEALDGDVFGGCENIREVVIPSNFGMYNIPSYKEITRVTVADGATNIAVNAFVDCSKLESVSIPESVVLIGDYAFVSCDSLVSINIPKGVQTIGKSAFSGCRGLEWMSFDGLPPEGLAGTEIDPELLIWYSADHASKWRSAAEEYGFVNAHPFMPRGAQESVPSAASTTVTMVVTNVVVHLIQRAEESSAVVPDDVTAGFVTVVTEIKGGAVSVPSTWKDNYPSFEQLYGADLAKAYTLKSGKVDSAGNELFVWQDYVAGTDPTDETDQFQATVTIVDGKPVVGFSPELSAAEAAKRKYTTWGKVRLQDAEWAVVPEGEESSFNFFKVSVEMR